MSLAVAPSQSRAVRKTSAGPRSCSVSLPTLSSSKDDWNWMISASPRRDGNCVAMVHIDTAAQWGVCAVRSPQAVAHTARRKLSMQYLQLPCIDITFLSTLQDCDVGSQLGTHNKLPRSTQKFKIPKNINILWHPKGVGRSEWYMYVSASTLWTFVPLIYSLAVCCVSTLWTGEVWS